MLQTRLPIVESLIGHSSPLNSKSRIPFSIQVRDSAASQFRPNLEQPLPQRLQLHPVEQLAHFLLSWADLSWVLPVTSIGYVVVALIGKVLLHETITGRRWAGIVLIVAGVALVSGSAPSTVPRKAAPQ